VATTGAPQKSASNQDGRQAFPSGREHECGRADHVWVGIADPAGQADGCVQAQSRYEGFEVGPFGSVAEDEQARVTSFEDAGGCADQCPEVLLLREPSDGEEHRRLSGSEPWMIERLVRHRAQLRGDDGVVHDLDVRRPQSRRMDEVVGRALRNGHDTIGPRVEAPDQPRHLAMAAAGRMRRLERERVLLVHDQPRVHAESVLAQMPTMLT
jgi:hypothetical protein